MMMWPTNGRLEGDNDDEVDGDDDDDDDDDDERRGGGGRGLDFNQAEKLPFLHPKVCSPDIFIVNLSQF